MKVIRAAALLVLAAAPLAAQTPAPSPNPDANEPPRIRETVDVEAELPAVPPSSTAATRLPVPVEEMPLSVSILSRRLLRDQAAFVLADALKNASGVNAGVAFGVFDAFTIRGFDSLSSGLVLTDGAPEPEATFYPMYNVRQIEVLKGPSAFLYGPNPLAGAVQIVRKQPSTTRFAEASLTYGRFGTFEGALDGNAASADGTLAFRVNGVWQGTDGHRDVGEGSIGAVNPSLLWRPNDATKVTASFEYMRSEWPPDSGLPFVGETGSLLADVPRERSYQSPRDASTQDVTRVRLDAERRLNGSVTLRNRAYYTELEWDSDGTLLSGAFPFPDGRTYVIRNLILLNDKQRLLGDQLELAASFRTGRLTHDLVAGVEATRYTDVFTQDVGLLAPLDLLNPVEPPGDSVPVTLLPAFGLAADARSLVVAPYVVDRISVGQRVHLFAGARLDRLDYEDVASGTERDDTRVSPVLGAVVSPAAGLSLHVSGGTAFAPPSTQVRGPREPETSRQVEAGFKLKFLANRAFLGGTVYTLQRNDIAIPDATGVLKQAGDQRSRGFEIDLSAEAAKGLIGYASYAYTDAELTSFAELLLTQVGPVFLDRTGNTPPFAPRHMLNVWLSKEFAGGFGVGAGVRALSEQFVSEDNRFSIPGYAVFDAAAFYRTGRLRFGVNLKNITGKEYATRGFGGVSAIPGRPFEVLGRVDVRLGTR
jgi:TonB-dependent siderophore receptor